MLCTSTALSTPPKFDLLAPPGDTGKVFRRRRDALSRTKLATLGQVSRRPVINGLPVARFEYRKTCMECVAARVLGVGG
jgi:hypothetical protein